MTPLSDTQSGGNLVGQDVALSRLFQFDLPRLKQSNQLFPEQGDISAIQRVLDIASGSGEWAISAAQATPQVQFVGIERDERLREPALLRRGTSSLRGRTIVRAAERWLMHFPS